MSNVPGAPDASNSGDISSHSQADGLFGDEYEDKGKSVLQCSEAQNTWDNGNYVPINGDYAPPIPPHVGLELDPVEGASPLGPCKRRKIDTRAQPNSCLEQQHSFLEKMNLYMQIQQHFHSFLGQSSVHKCHVGAGTSKPTDKVLTKAPRNHKYSTASKSKQNSKIKISKCSKKEPKRIQHSKSPIKLMDNSSKSLGLMKELKKSDVGPLGRIVLPKKQAEQHLPVLSEKDGIMIDMMDFATSNIWHLKYRYWPNNKSRMYILENTKQWVKSHGLEAGDLMTIYEDESGQKVIKATKVIKKECKGGHASTVENVNKDIVIVPPIDNTNVVKEECEDDDQCTTVTVTVNEDNTIDDSVTGYAGNEDTVTVNAPVPFNEDTVTVNASVPFNEDNVTVEAPVPVNEDNTNIIEDSVKDYKNIMAAVAGLPTLGIDDINTESFSMMGIDDTITTDNCCDSETEAIRPW